MAEVVDRGRADQHRDRDDRAHRNRDQQRQRALVGPERAQGFAGELLAGGPARTALRRLARRLALRGASRLAHPDRPAPRAARSSRAAASGSAASAIARSTTARSAPAAVTSPMLPAFSPPIAKNGTRAFAAA